MHGSNNMASFKSSQAPSASGVQLFATGSVYSCLQTVPNGATRISKLGMKLGVELGKADEFCYVLDKFWGWPRLQKTVFGLCWTVSILLHVNANKFELCREKVPFAKVQR